MKTLQLDFIKCIIPKSQTFKHFLAFLPDAYLATKIPDMSGKNLTYGNPNLETSTVFSVFSNIIQNDLIAAIDDVVRYNIKEISAALFVAPEVDESTDVTNKADLCHYVAKSEVACEVKEAFLGFDDVSNDRRAAATYF